MVTQLSVALCYETHLISHFIYPLPVPEAQFSCPEEMEIKCWDGGWGVAVGKEWERWRGRHFLLPSKPSAKLREEAGPLLPQELASDPEHWLWAP